MTPDAVFLARLIDGAAVQEGRQPTKPVKHRLLAVIRHASGQLAIIRIGLLNIALRGGIYVVHARRPSLGAKIACRIQKP